MWSVVIAGTVLGAAALAVHPYALQFYGDANSRLVQARLIADSADPGLHWLGSVWLPLPALIFLPFSLIDPLFSTGLVGLVVGLPMLAGAAVSLYRLALHVGGDRTVALLVALCVALNPNLLYVSMTTMTETMTLYFVIAAVAGWIGWIATRHVPGTGVRPLIVASLHAAAATLCRYEAWLFTAVGAAGVSVFVLTLRTTVARKAALCGAVAVAFSGIACWLVWNAVQFGDPLYFNHAEFYSAAWQAQRRPVRAAYYLQLGNTLAIYGVTMLAVFGLPFLAVSTAGAGLLAGRRPRSETLFLAAVLLAMPLFTLLSVYMGVAEMTRWWNSRYVLLLAPLVAVSLALAFGRWARVARSSRLVHGTIVGLFLLTTAWQAGVQQGRVVTVADAAGGFHYGWTPAATEVAGLLRREWRGGAILSATGSGQSHRIMQPSGVPTRMFTTGLDVNRRLLDPGTVRDEFDWIVIGLDPSADGSAIARTLLASRGQLERTHGVVMQNTYYVVLRRDHGPRSTPGRF